MCTHYSNLILPMFCGVSKIFWAHTDALMCCGCLHQQWRSLSSCCQHTIQEISLRQPALNNPPTTTGHCRSLKKAAKIYTLLRQILASVTPQCPFLHSQRCWHHPHPIQFQNALPIPRSDFTETQAAWHSRLHYTHPFCGIAPKIHKAQ